MSHLETTDSSECDRYDSPFPARTDRSFRVFERPETASLTYTDDVMYLSRSCIGDESDRESIEYYNLPYYRNVAELMLSGWSEVLTDLEKVGQMVAHAQRVEAIKDRFCSEVSNLGDVVAIAFDDCSCSSGVFCFWVVLRDWNLDTQHQIYEVRRKIESSEGMRIDLKIIPLKEKDISRVIHDRIDPLFIR